MPGYCWPHLSIDFISESRYLNDKGVIQGVLDDVVLEAGMRILQKAVVYQTDTSGPWGYSTGLTGFVVLAESHAAIHTFLEQRVVMLDIFSCKPFDYEAVVSYLKEELEADKTHTVEGHLHWRKFPPTPSGMTATMRSEVE